MREASVGRVLVASLHQAISDELPTRLGFYETWLDAEGLREGTIGLPPLLAVLSFLRQEGDAYDRVVTRAGEYAAEWTVESIASVERSFIAAAPRWLRVRLLLRVAKLLVRRSYHGARAVGTMRRGAAHVSLEGSVFCSVREPAPSPLCGFYAAACARLLALFDVEATASVVSCRGAGAFEQRCQLAISITADRSTEDAEATAA